ncbi:MAG: hypothetical protein NT166_05420 [Candidatus Aminicenantes bacterium]|nr:hypothetical protein [Candidatus Aminicenantes bacterium]
MMLWSGYQVDRQQAMGEERDSRDISPDIYGISSSAIRTSSLYTYTYCPR